MRTVEYKGVKYRSIQSICIALGLAKHYHAIRRRIISGWNVADAVETPFAFPVQDHLGNYYKDWTAMARAYGFKVKTLQNRLDSGWSLERALTEPVHMTGARAGIMHGMRITV